MTNTGAKFVVALMLLTFSLNCFAQVYSVNIYSGGRTYEHQWHIGSSTHWFGFTQYREYQDANGMVLLTSEQHRTVRRPVYTQIDLIAVHFRLPIPAWVVGVIGFLLLISLGVLSAGARRRIGPLSRNGNIVASPQAQH
mgnify:CR=1 FL=1